MDSAHYTLVSFRVQPESVPLSMFAELMVCEYGYPNDPPLRVCICTLPSCIVIILLRSELASRLPVRMVLAAKQTSTAIAW